MPPYIYKYCHNDTIDEENWITIRMNIHHDKTRKKFLFLSLLLLILEAGFIIAVDMMMRYSDSFHVP